MTTPDMVAVEYAYSVADITDLSKPPNERHMGKFLSMTGGDMTMDMISYNWADNVGGVTTSFVPGQISFSPIKLSRNLDSLSQSLINWFNSIALGAVVKKNISIIQEDKDAPSVPLAEWWLLNTLPIAQPGFSYNSYRGSSSAKYKLTLQAEVIQFHALPLSNPLKKPKT